MERKAFFSCVEMQFCVAEEGFLYHFLLPHLTGIVPQIGTQFSRFPLGFAVYVVYEIISLSDICDLL